MSTKDNAPAPGSKHIQTGETTPPLDHETYTREFNKRRAQADAARSRNSRSRTAAAAPTDEDGGGDEPTGDDRTLYGHKLSVYRRQVGDAVGEDRKSILMKNDGIGDQRADEIAAALDE